MADWRRQTVYVSRSSKRCEVGWVKGWNGVDCDGRVSTAWRNYDRRLRGLYPSAHLSTQATQSVRLSVRHCCLLPYRSRFGRRRHGVAPCVDYGTRTLGILLFNTGVGCMAYPLQTHYLSHPWLCCAVCFVEIRIVLSLLKWELSRHCPLVDLVTKVV